MEEKEFEAKLEDLARWTKVQILELLSSLDRINKEVEDAEAMQKEVRRLERQLKLQEARLEAIKAGTELDNKGGHQ